MWIICFRRVLSLTKGFVSICVLLYKSIRIKTIFAIVLQICVEYSGDVKARYFPMNSMDAVTDTKPIFFFFFFFRNRSFFDV